MGFMDDVKEDQILQIQVVIVTFFLVVFPAYFFMKAAATDDVAGMGGVGTYTVTGEFSYLDFASGEEFVADGTPLTIDLNTDSVSEVSGKNIVGVLVTMTYAEDETENSVIPLGCATGGSHSADAARWHYLPHCAPINRYTQTGPVSVHREYSSIAG